MKRPKAIHNLIRVRFSSRAYDDRPQNIATQVRTLDFISIGGRYGRPHSRSVSNQDERPKRNVLGEFRQHGRQPCQIRLEIYALLACVIHWHYQGRSVQGETNGQTFA